MYQIKLHYSTKHYANGPHKCTLYTTTCKVKGSTCVFNTLLEAARHLPQVHHDLGVALLAQPQKLNTMRKAMNHLTVHCNISVRQHAQYFACCWCSPPLLVAETELHKKGHGLYQSWVGVCVYKHQVLFTTCFWNILLRRSTSHRSSVVNST